MAWVVLTVLFTVLLANMPRLKAEEETLHQPVELLDNEPSVELIAQTTWVEPNGTVTLRLDLSGTDPNDRLQATLHDRLLRRSQVAETVTGQGLRRRLRTLANTTVGELKPDANGMVELKFGLRSQAGDSNRQLITQAGVYPIAVSLSSTNDSAASEFVTHIVRLPSSVDKPLNLAIVQPLMAAPSLQPEATTIIATDTRDRLTRAAEIFSLEPEVSITYQITPETLLGLASSDHEEDGVLLGRLSDILRQGTVAASSFVEVDPDTLIQSGLADELGSQLALGTSTLASDLSLPTEGSIWVDRGQLGPVGLNEVVKRGATRLVVPHESLVGDLPDLLVKPFDLTTTNGGRVMALSTDPALQEHFDGEYPARLQAQHLLTDLASIWFERPAYARATVLVLPEEVAEAALLTPLLNGLATSPLVEVTTVRSAMTNADPASVNGIDSTVTKPGDRLALTLKDIDKPESLGRYAEALARTRRQVNSYSEIFTESGLVRISYDLRIATSISSELSLTERLRYLTEITDEIHDVTSMLRLPESGAVTLPSRDGVIPLTLFNDSGQPARVVLQLESDKLEFRDGDRMEFVLTEPTTPIEIRVRARASGAFPLNLSLVSPDGDIELDTFRYTVRSTAVSGVGVAISVAAVLVLGLWWIQTARRARAEHRSSTMDPNPNHPITRV